MKAFYIPPALRGILTQSRFTVAQLQDVRGLVGTLSEEDVAFYLRLQTLPTLAIPVEIADSFAWVNVEDALTSLQTDDESAQTVLANIKRYLQEWSVSEASVDLQIDDKRLTCDLWDEETVVFSHVAVSDDTVETSIYDRLLQQLYGFMPFHQLTGLPAFVGYLRKQQKTIESAS